MFDSFMKKFLPQQEKDKKNGGEQQIFPDQIKNDAPLSLEEEKAEARANEERRLALMRSQEKFKKGRENISKNIYNVVMSKDVLPTYQEYKSGLSHSEKMEAALDTFLSQEVPKVGDDEFASVRADYINLIKKDVVEPYLNDENRKKLIQSRESQVLYGGEYATLEDAERLEQFKQEVMNVMKTLEENSRKNVPQEVMQRGNASEIGQVILEDRIFDSMSKLNSDLDSLSTVNEKKMKAQLAIIKSLSNGFKNSRHNGFGGVSQVTLFPLGSGYSPTFQEVSNVLGINTDNLSNGTLVDRLHGSQESQQRYYNLPQNYTDQRYPGVEIQFQIVPRSERDTVNSENIEFRYNVIDKRPQD